MKFNTFDTETSASRRENERTRGREDIAEEWRARARRKEVGGGGVRAAKTHNECHS